MSAMAADVMKMGLTYQIHCPIKVRVDPDPLGDINCIIRVLRREDDTPIRSVLYPNTTGLQPHIGYGKSERGWKTGPSWNGWAASMYSVPTWYVEVDGKRITEIDEYDRDLSQPRLPTPKPPLRQRATTAVAKHARSAADAIAKRFGYTPTHECDCRDWDE